MNYKILAVISFALISVMSFSQDTTNMKYIRFYQYLNREKDLSQKQLTAIFPIIKKYGKNYSSDTRKDEPGFWSTKEILKISQASLLGITLNCSDCYYEYFLLYQSPNRIEGIHEDSPQKLLNKLLKLLKKDKINITENEMQSLVHHSFFYFDFITFFKSKTRGIQYIEK